MEYLEPFSRTVYLSLGSNIGSKIENINNAIQLLIDCDIIANPTISSFYESAPYGFTNQDFFINIALKAETNHSLFEFLFFLKTAEYLIGRIKREKWHEREIDIDIIFFDDLIFENKYLSIPHKEFRLRNFVLVPLLEIAPELIDPTTKKSIKQLLEECEDKSGIEKWKPPPHFEKLSASPKRMYDNYII